MDCHCVAREKANSKSILHCDFEVSSRVLVVIVIR